MVGQTLGHYRILDKLGAGGMGEVYRAEDTTLDREVALKILPPELAESQERLDRFQREAKTLAALDHPKPWVAVVDGGAAYRAMRDVLTGSGIPVFATADRAVRALSRYVTWRLRTHNN